MKAFTDTELVNYNQQFIYKLRQLYLSDKKVFNQLKCMIPQYYTINDRQTHSLVEHSQNGLGASPEIARLKEEGVNYLYKICSVDLLNIVKKKVHVFNKENDHNKICNYLEQIKFFGTPEYLMSNKIILDSNFFLNTLTSFKDMGTIGKSLLSIFPQIEITNRYWLRFQTLTKQEKELLKLLAEGKSVKEVSEIFCLSKHTIHTHKRNIYNKLDIHKLSDLVKVALILDLLEE